MIFQKIKKPLCVLTAVFVLSLSVSLFTFADSVGDFYTLSSGTYISFSSAYARVYGSDTSSGYSIIFDYYCPITRLSFENTQVVCTCIVSYLDGTSQEFNVNAPSSSDLWNGTSRDVTSIVVSAPSSSGTVIIRGLHIYSSSVSSSSIGLPVPVLTAPIYYESLMDDVGDFGTSMLSVWGQVVAFVTAAWPCLIPLLAFLFVLGIRSARKQYKG